jgi:hypothetical protein
MVEAGVLPNDALIGIPTKIAALVPLYIAYGTGTTADAITDTTVEGEITTGGLARAVATAAYESSYKLVLTRTAIATANHTIRKIGVLDEAAAGHPWGVRKYSSAHGVLNGNRVVGTVRFTFGRPA